MRIFRAVSRAIFPQVRRAAGGAGVLLLAAVSAAGAHTETGAEFGPHELPTELHTRMVVLSDGDRSYTTTHWRRDGRLRQILFAPASGKIPAYAATTDIAGGSALFGTGRPGRLTDVGVVRFAADVSPDGYDPLDGELFGYASPLITRQRGGEAVFTEAQLGGRTVLRATTPVAESECAGLESGIRTVDLDPGTLVPVRILERRGGKLTRSMFVSTQAARSSDFARVRSVGKRTYSDAGFIRRLPRRAGPAVGIDVELPTRLPAGYRFAWSGSALRGAIMGPEGSFPRSGPVFYVRYQRGLESLELTMRTARSTLTRDWDQSDPFGGECAAADQSTVMLGSTVARYAIPERGAPHLWWRSGSRLYTLTGSMSAEQLAAVARTLQPISNTI